MTLLTAPLNPASFARIIRMMSVKFRLADNIQSSGLTNCNFIVTDLGPQFWMADIGLINYSNAEAKKIQGLIEFMGGGLRDFYLFDPRCEFPEADPDGSILGAGTVSITNVNNTNEIKFNGPNGYIYTPGDMFHFDYGAGNAYRALHRIVGLDPIVANGSGNTDWFQITPELADTTLTTPKQVTIIRPSARMKLISDGTDAGTAKQMMTTGMALKCRQVP